MSRSPFLFKGYGAVKYRQPDTLVLVYGKEEQRENVLVVGSGGACLVAAIAARRSGADVWSSKGKAGPWYMHRPCRGIFTLACGGFSPEEHYRKTLETVITKMTKN